LDENINTIKKNTEALIEASREIGLEVNPKCMVVSQHQNAGRSYTLLIANKSFEIVVRFKYFRATV